MRPPRNRDGSRRDTAPYPPLPPRTDLEEISRMNAFRRRHPEIRIYPGDFGVWYAEGPVDDGEGRAHGHGLGRLMDKLEARFAPDTG